MKRLLRMMILLAALWPAAAMADDVRQGWGFQFRQDTFDKTLFPVAIMSEASERYDKASLFVACDEGGSLIAAYNPSGIISFDQSAKVQFRDGDVTKEFSFSAVDIPHLGTYRGLSKEDSIALFAIFERAAGGDVPFRAKDKQGTFTSLGAAETFKIVLERCPSAK